MIDDDRERLVQAVITAYLAANREGSAPDREAILAEHPALADELREFFDDYDKLAQMDSPFPLAAGRSSSSDDVPPDSPAGAGSGPPDSTIEGEPDGGSAAKRAGARFVSTLSAGPSLSRGQRVRFFGDYELGAELGTGVMGIVYRGHQVSADRPVAVKLVRPELLMDDDTLRRFRTQAEAVALLDHPGIVPVYEVGAFDGQWYVSMKLIEANSLVHLQFDYKDDPRASAKLAAEVTEAVAYAHTRGVLHRDLKPSNLLIDPEGHPHVIDFGLAKQLATDRGITRARAVLGALEYMSPEEAAERRPATTAATDVYGLGAILYTLLTGLPPSSGYSMAEVLSAVQTAPPEPPAKLNPKVPRDLEAICLKCLEKEPERRYASAQMLAEDLRAWLAHRPIAARPAGLFKRGALFARRSPALAAIYGLTAAVVLLTGFEGMIARPWRAAKLAASQTLAARGGEEQARIAAEKASADAEDARGLARFAQARVAAVEYGRTMEAAHQALRDDHVVEAVALLGGTRPGLRGWEWRFVSSLCRPELVSLRGPKDGFYSAGFRSDGAQIVTLHQSGAVQFWDAKTGRELAARKGHTIRSGASPSSDWSRVVTPIEGSAAQIWIVQTGAVTSTLSPHTSPVVAAAFSRDGRRVVTTCEDGVSKVWDAAAGTEIATFRGNRPLLAPGQRTAAGDASVFRPDGTSVASADREGLVKLWDAATGHESRAFAGEAPCESLAFSEDGARLLVGYQDGGTARVWDVNSGAHVLTLRGHTGSVLGAAFSPDGFWIVTASEDHSARIWNARNGTPVLTLTGHTAPVSSARFSPDRSRVITTAPGDMTATVRVWDARQEVESWVLDRGVGVGGARFSPDGSRIVTTQGSARSLPHTMIFDARSGRRLFSLDDESPDSASFSPDGSRIVTTGLDGWARVWDTRGKVRLLGKMKGRMTAAFSPDGSRIVTASDDKLVRVWDAASSTLSLTLKGHKDRVSSAVFDSDGIRIVTAGADGTARVWDAGSGAALFVLEGHTRALRWTSISSDGTRIVTASEDGSAKVWDAKKGTELFTLIGHTDAVWCASFSPDGARIITASADKTAKLWSTEFGTEVLTLRAHSAIVRTAFFSPDGERIVTASDDGTSRIWDARPFGVSQAERAGVAEGTGSGR
jgi:WD40 repeat protein